jgi:hypothetical protein
MTLKISYTERRRCSRGARFEGLIGYRLEISGAEHFFIK